MFLDVMSDSPPTDRPDPADRPERLPRRHVGSLRSTFSPSYKQVRRQKLERPYSAPARYFTH